MRCNSSKVHLRKFRRSPITLVCQVKKSLWGGTAAREGETVVMGIGAMAFSRALAAWLSIYAKSKLKIKIRIFILHKIFFACLKKSSSQCFLFFVFFKFKVSIGMRNTALCKREVAVYHKKPDAGGAEIQTCELIRFHILRQRATVDNRLELYLYTTHRCCGLMDKSQTPATASYNLQSTTKHLQITLQLKYVHYIPLNYRDEKHCLTSCRKETIKKKKKSEKCLSTSEKKPKRCPLFHTGGEFNPY